MNGSVIKPATQSYFRSNYMQLSPFSINNFFVILRQITSTSAHNNSNAFTNFIHSRYREVKSAKPELSNYDVIRKLAQLYKSLPVEEVEKLKLEAKEHQSHVKKATKFAYRNGMPKSPPNSGLKVFMREKLKDSKGTPVSQMRNDFKDTVKQWMSLPESDQLEYNNIAKDLKNDYETKLKEWATKNNIQYTKRISILADRFYRAYYPK
ncbi:unnamed protein product [Schistosoma intercalatum]|nr:unnamed protein product [Schistosoma intercalatum]CAH8597622.1 unnamed protein product [Schistosoma intercalatum]